MLQASLWLITKWIGGGRHQISSNMHQLWLCDVKICGRKLFLPSALWVRILSSLGWSELTQVSWNTEPEHIGFSLWVVIFSHFTVSQERWLWEVLAKDNRCMFWNLMRKAEGSLSIGKTHLKVLFSQTQFTSHIKLWPPNASAVIRYLFYSTWEVLWNMGCEMIIKLNLLLGCLYWLSFICW